MNLSTFEEKKVEEFIKYRISNYFDEQNLILKNPHGGRKGMSNITAWACIDIDCSEVIEKNNLGFF